MARSIGLVVVILSLVAWVSRVVAQPPPSDGIEDRARAWAELLKSDDSEDHALATARLLKIGAAARPALERALAHSKSADQRARLQAVLTLLPKGPAKPAGPPALDPPKGEVEVHAVGIHYPGAYFQLMMTGHRGVDWIGMCDLLVTQGEDAAPRFSKRIWDLLTPASRALAQDQEFLKAADDVTHDRRRELPNERVYERLRVITFDLEAVLSRADLIRKEDRLPKGLHPEAAELLKADRELSLLEKKYLHRRLFEAAFAGFVKPIDFTLARNTNLVKVGRTERPVVLVLTAYNATRWKVEAAPDARIERVIVGGYHVQDLVGFNGRVDYYVHEMPNRRPASEPRHFFGYPQDDHQYGDVKTAIKRILGREIDTIQGSYEYDPAAPIVIGTLKKASDEPLRRREG